MDGLYNALWVTPYVWISKVLRPEWVDSLYHGVVSTCRGLHAALTQTQTGNLRWYATSMVIGLIAVLTYMGWGV